MTERYANLRFPLTPAALALAIALAAPTVAQTAEPQPETAEPAAKKPKPKKICRAEQKTATRLGVKKTCRTAEEWAKIDEADRERVKRDIPIG